MIPSIGRIVAYRLTQQDVDQIRASRWSLPDSNTHGNDVYADDTFPMMITRVWGDTPESCVQGQVFLDGNDTLWVTSVQQGDDQRQWHELPRV